MKYILLALLLIALALVLFMRLKSPGPSAPAEDAAAVPEGTEEPSPSAEPTPKATVEPSPEPTPTPGPTPEPEPTPKIFTLSVIGDCTLTSHQNLADTSPYSYAGRMQGDYSYPFSGTAEYFKNDDFTISNLECTFSDQRMWSDRTFYFRAPTEYVNILIEGGVDFVTTANNHALDFGQAGLDSTFAALDEYGFTYGKEGQAQLYTTASGLTLGIYCDYNGYQPNIEKCQNAIAQLKEDGAEYIICAFHWGVELKYRPNEYQMKLARACVDAGADLIYGSHTHCLQPIEEYNGGLILYSMGNWSFGGNTSPADRDTAIVQVRVKRDLDGSISTDGYDIIPCCISSIPVGSDNGADNDYRPCPYEPGTEDYERALSKITGEYQGPDGQANYDSWHASWG